MFKKFFVSFLFCLLFIPSCLVFANDSVEDLVIPLGASDVDFYAENLEESKKKYEDYKNNCSAYITFTKVINKIKIRYVYDFSKYIGTPFKLGTDSRGTYISFVNGGKIIVNGYYYYYEAGGTGYTAYSLEKIYLSDTLESTVPESYFNITFSEDSDLSIFPPPPSIEGEGNYGYKFVYPSNDDIINLYADSNSNYYKVPFKVKVKNFYTTLSVKKLEENIKDNFKINNYKTEITSFVWQSKPDLIGINEVNEFTVEGYYYIYSSNLPTSEKISATIYQPVDKNWIDGSIKVSYTTDGSKPQYNPNAPTDDGVSDNLGSIPNAPTDGGVTEWLKYFGDLVIWFVTYPFKLLNEVFTVLITYITNMFNILTPVTEQLNNVLSFIPRDILNVCWGFLSFTLLYSVITGVLKMIRR